MTISFNCLPEGLSLADLVRSDTITAIDIRFCRREGASGADATNIVTCAPSEAGFATLYGITDGGEARAVHDIDLTSTGADELSAACHALFAAILAVRCGQTVPEVPAPHVGVLRAAARRQYACDTIEIDGDAALSEADDGAWVAAWVWVARDGAGDQA